MITASDPVELYQPGPLLGVPSPSPFCVKVEAWLRLTDTAYRVVPTVDPRRGPKGKVPWVRFGGRTVGDSEAILDALVEATGKDLDEGLGARDRALAAALRALAEERLYWTMVHERWMDPAVWPGMRAALSSMLPRPARLLAPAIVRRRVRAQLVAAGMGRHSPEEIAAHGRRDIDALATLLGDRPFFLGERPRRVDTTMYGFLVNLVRVELDGALVRHARAHEALVAYTERMHALTFAGESEALAA